MPTIIGDTIRHGKPRVPFVPVMLSVKQLGACYFRQIMRDRADPKRHQPGDRPGALVVRCRRGLLRRPDRTARRASDEQALVQYRLPRSQCEQINTSARQPTQRNCRGESIGKACGVLDKNVRFVTRYACNVPVVRVRVGAWHRKASKLWAMPRLLPQDGSLCAQALANASPNHPVVA